MIEGEIVYNSGSPVHEKDRNASALNDVVITRKGFSRIISLGIYVNDDLVDKFKGDGVIISTPTGSTAYNLSAGGPIVTPRAAVMVITPICPHSLSPRSVVVSAEDTIRIVVGKSKKTQEAEAAVSFDGRNEIDLGTNDSIVIKKAEHSTKLIKLNRTGIYEVLRSKLGNNGD
jgi:NAD+ kinase